MAVTVSLPVLWLSNAAMKNSQVKKHETTQYNITKLNQLKQNRAAPVRQDMAHKKVVNTGGENQTPNVTYHLWAELARSQAKTSVSAAAGSECC